MTTSKSNKTKELTESLKLAISENNVESAADLIKLGADVNASTNDRSG